MDGFATSHMLSEALHAGRRSCCSEFLGDPSGRIKAPTVAQEMLFGAKGRVYPACAVSDAAQRRLRARQHDRGARPISTPTPMRSSATTKARLHRATLELDPRKRCTRQWRRQWLNAYEKGTRQRVPALVDPHNPGLTGGVQNQPDFQAGSVDHRTHFAADVPRFVREAMREYSELTGRDYSAGQDLLCATTPKP